MKFKTSFFTASVFIFYLGERKIYQIKKLIHCLIGAVFTVTLCRDFIIPHQYWQLCDENKNFFGIFNFIMCSKKQCIWEFSKCHKSVGAFIGRPPWWYCLLIHITFDVMKIMYSILHAMRAIVCVGHERANTVSSYKIAVTLWYLYSLFLSQCLCLYLRASNERPYEL